MFTNFLQLCITVYVCVCVCVGTEEMVDAKVKELRASGTQAVLIQKIRYRSLSVGHYPLESEVTDHVPGFHETITSKFVCSQPL